MKVNPPAPDQPPPDGAYGEVPDAVIVIFCAAVRPDGRRSQTLRRRVEAAARFGARFDRPRFIPTGAKGRFGQAEAAVMAQVLMQAGYSQDHIVQEKPGTDTLSSVRAVLPMLPPGSRVYACSSAYHLPRCLLLL